MSNWRDLARQGVPFDQWPLDAKIQAVQDHTAAVFRPFPTEEDWELFRLQHPYVANFAQFIATITMTMLLPDEPSGGAVFAGLLQYEAPVGSHTRWRATVTLPAGVTPPGGDVIFELFGPIGQVELKRVPVSSGSAGYVTVGLPAGQYWLRARYEPLNLGTTPSAQTVKLTVG